MKTCEVKKFFVILSTYSVEHFSVRTAQRNCAIAHHTAVNVELEAEDTSAKVFRQKVKPTLASRSALCVYSPQTANCMLALS